MNQAEKKRLTRLLVKGLIHQCEISEIEAYRIVKKAGVDFLQDDCEHTTEDRLAYLVFKVLVDVNKYPEFEGYIDKMTYRYCPGPQKAKKQK